MAEYLSHMSGPRDAPRPEEKQGGSGAAAEKQGLLAKAVCKIQANPSAARAAVIAIGALVLLIVVMLVYFRGIGPVGPFGAYVALRKTAPKSAPKSKDGMAPKSKTDEDEPQAKTETEELIEELNA